MEIRAGGDASPAKSQTVGDGWTIPVQRVQVMVARAAQIAVEKERANKEISGSTAGLDGWKC
jgi:hypothetical protein